MIETVKSIIAVAQINRPDLSLCNQLNLRGFNAKIIKSSVCVYLELVNSEIPFVFLVPAELLAYNPRFSLDAMEYGGMEESGIGKAIVVSGIAGQALNPYSAPENPSCGIHAFFLSHAQIVTIASTIEGEKTEVVIESHKIFLQHENTRNFAKIISKTEWKGKIGIYEVKWQCSKCGMLLSHKPTDKHSGKSGGCYGQMKAFVNMEGGLNRFGFAVAAAIEKSKCLNCQDVHYKNEPSEDND